MSSEQDCNNKRPSVSCISLFLPFFIVVFVTIGLIKTSSGDIEKGVFLIVVGISLLLIFPTRFFARKVFSGKLGDFLKGDEIEHPIIRTKRFIFSIREERRPWWILYSFLLVLGLILVYVIMNYVN